MQILRKISSKNIYFSLKVFLTFLTLGSYAFLVACGIFGPSGEYIWKNEELYGKVSSQEYHKQFKKAQYTCEIESLKIPLPSPNCVGSTNIDNSNYINMVQDQTQKQTPYVNECECDEFGFLRQQNNYGQNYNCPCNNKKKNIPNNYNSNQSQRGRVQANNSNQSGIYCDYTAIKHAEEAQNKLFRACMGLKGWEEVWHEYAK